MLNNDYNKQYERRQRIKAWTAELDSRIGNLIEENGFNRLKALIGKGQLQKIRLSWTALYFTIVFLPFLFVHAS